MYVVDKAIFFQERQQFRLGHHTTLYSPALENAVYTIGAAYTDRLHADIDGATDEFFGFRAKALLDIEIDSPTIATAQALLVLSSHEAAHMRDSRGWIYSGMAVQILSDLGLHLNLALDLSKFHHTNSSTGEVALLRQNLFWSANTIDTLWSAYSGRPSLMKRLAHNIPNPLPSTNYTWEYYTDEYSTMTFPKDFDFHAAAHVHAYLAKLMTVFARVSEVLYSGVPDVLDDLQSFVVEFDAELQNWLSTLPPALCVDYSSTRTAIYLPAVLELQLIFNECVILLHRPLIAADESSRLSISPTHRDAAQSFSKCVQAARRVCQLLTIFRQRYGLRRPHHQMVHVTMTAGLIHVFQMCITSTGTAENQRAQQGFLTCIQSLGEMGQTYKSASRALDVITSLGQSWQNDAFAGRRVKWPKLQ
ncbi:Fungal specific transcription factor domain-containing protein [Cladophialophora immunda]|nr:Fungal specific transcription factor domain-containing protein [Cladophialophora immunda]